MTGVRGMLSLAIALTLGAGLIAAAPPAAAATTTPNSVLVDYNGGQYQISTTTLSGPIGATFAFQNRINGQSLYLQNQGGSVSLGGTSCTANHTCAVAEGRDGTFTVTGLGTIAVNTGATDGRFTITISDGSGSSDAEPPRATVGFDANGGTCTTASTGALLQGTWAAVPSEGACTRPGWTLTGFSTSPTNTPGSVFIPPGGSTAVTSDNTLYAQWRIRVAADWTSTDCPGADVHDITLGETVTLPDAKVCGDEILAGWGLSPAVATPVTYTPGQSVQPTENLTVWAVWSPVRHVTLICSEAAAAATQVVDVGNDLPMTLPLSCAGVQASSWSTTADGSGTSYPAGSPFRTSADTVLYAQASDTEVTVTWHGNGGTCPAASTSVAWGSAFAPAACTRTGYAITDWTTDGTSTGTSLLGTALRSSVDAYPIWAAVPLLGANWVYTCTAQVTPATWNPTTRQFEVTLPPVTGCDNAPYTLLSWNTELDGSGDSALPGATIPLAASTFYAAQWGVPVTFDYNLPPGDTSCPTTTLLLPFGQPFTLPAGSTCLRTNYLLADWATTRVWASGVDPHLAQPGGTLSALTPTTFYAWWGPPIDIVFDPDGGTCAAPTMTVGLGGLFTLPTATDCVRTDYRLTGWSLTSNASRPYFAPGSTGIAIFPFGDPKLVAQWVSTSHCSAAPAPNVDWHACDKRGVDLTAADLHGADLQYALFDRSTLTRANLTGATVTGASFTQATLASANLASLDLSGSDLSGSDLSEAILTSAVLHNANLAFSNLTGTRLGSATLTNANLTGAQAPTASLSGADLTGANLFMTNFEGTDLSGATLTHQNLTTARLTGAILRSANLADANLSKTRLNSVTFAGATLDGADLSDVTGTGVSFAGAHGGEVSLTGATLPSVDLNGANLPSLSAAGAKLRKATARAATLTGADLSGAALAKADFTEATLTGALLTSQNLSDVDFTKATLDTASFTGTTIGTANLTQASVQEVNLQGKDLSGATLPRAHFGGSNLTNANLSNRDLTAVHFPNANLSNANFQGAYTAKIGQGCQAENYYRNSQVIVQVAMRNLPVVPWRWREMTYSRRGNPRGYVTMYGNVQWGMDDRGDFLMYCALP